MTMTHLWNNHLQRPRRFKNTNQELIHKIDSAAVAFYNKEMR